MNIDDLRAWGANVDEGLTRCMNNEAFYLRLVETVKNEAGFARLQESMAAGDWHGGFEAAHALKGVLGNLSLTPLFDPVNELCELLRPEQPVDCSALLATVSEQFEAFKAL